MKKIAGALLAITAVGATAAVNAANIELICAINEKDQRTGVVTRHEGVAIMVPENDSRKVTPLGRGRDNVSITEWMITPNDVYYKRHKIIEGDTVEYESSTIHIKSGEVKGSIRHTPSPYLRVRGHKHKDSTFRGQCYLAEKQEQPEAAEEKASVQKPASAAE